MYRGKLPHLQQSRGAVQVELMESVLKPPGSVLLQLRYDGLLSNFAFKSNSRRYNPKP